MIKLARVARDCKPNCRGKRSRAATTWPSRGRTAADVLHFSRSDRWYNLRAGERSVFVDDTFHYVAGTMLAKVR